MKKSEKFVIAVELTLALVAALLMFVSIGRIIDGNMSFMFSVIALIVSSYIFFSLIDDIRRIKNKDNNTK